ncbi:MAG: T9SS type A sorting domain-containing protein [Cytophagaceae bacterium]
MLKRLFFILTIFHSYEALSSNWDLFPLNQTSYYLNPEKNEVQIYLMDSVYWEDNIKVSLFYSKHNLPGDGFCQVNYFDFFPTRKKDFIHSLQQKNDSIYHYSDHTFSPFYFIPTANPGDSWIINMGDQRLQFTCKEKIETSFFNISDSVKIFKIYLDDIELTDHTFHLSKSYGLLQFVPFNLLLDGNPNNYLSYKLIGFEKDNINHGYKQPLFHDYFHLKPGDVLMWEKVFKNDFDITASDYSVYYKDSITNLQITQNEVTYVFNQTVYNQFTSNNIRYHVGLTKSYQKSDYDFLEKFTSWPVIKSNIEHFNEIYFKESGSLGIKYDLEIEDTITYFTIEDNLKYYNTSHCQIEQIPDYTEKQVFNTVFGLVEVVEYSVSLTHLKLIGSRIDGIERGTLTNLSLKKEFPLSIRIFPNPTTNILNLAVSNQEEVEYEILSYTGKLTKKGILKGNYQINISELTSGFYIIHLISGTQTRWEKFEKH